MMSHLRQSGIRQVGRVPWGAHICLFYETKQDLLDTHAAFFEAGLRDNELCVWLVSEPASVLDAREALARAIPDYERHEQAGRIELLSGRNWYLHQGTFDLCRITGEIEDKVADALAKGFLGARVSGNALWAGTAKWQSFMHYEQEIERSLAGRRIVALCTYWLKDCSSTDLLSVAKAHDAAIVRRHGEWQMLEYVPTPSVSGPLTDREIEVLTWVARGKSAWEIAEILSISKRTVDEHAQRSVQKLGATNRAQGVALALRARLIDPDGSE